MHNYTIYLRNLEDYQEDEEARQEHTRHLEEIENQLDAEFGTINISSKRKKNLVDDSCESEINEDEEDLESDSYCVVCKKIFKSS